jgi:hypothetical protein
MRVDTLLAAALPGLLSQFLEMVALGRMGHLASYLGR